VSAAILLSLSRGAFLGLAAGFVVFVLTDRRRLQVTLTAGALAAIGTLLVIHSNPQRFHEAVTLKQNVAQENVSTRFGAWSAAARLASDHPLLGRRAGELPVPLQRAHGPAAGTFTLTVAHNALLDVGAELGLVAMALLALYLMLAFVRLSSAIQLGYGDPGFVRALRISLTIAIVSAMFLSEQYFLPFWLIGGLAAAIWTGQRRAAKAHPRAMRVVYVSTLERGGPVTHLRLLAPRVAAEGVDVEVICASERSRRASARSTSRRGPLRSGTSSTCAAARRSGGGSDEADLVHTHDRRAGLFGRIGGRLRGRVSPYAARDARGDRSARRPAGGAGPAGRVAGPARWLEHGYLPLEAGLTRLGHVVAPSQAMATSCSRTAFRSRLCT
jgi:hypothetical protein